MAFKIIAAIIGISFPVSILFATKLTINRTTFFNSISAKLSPSSTL